MTHDSRGDVMTFLNEVAADYPGAISLAAGRPTDTFAHRLSPAVLMDALQLFASKGDYPAGVLQYGRTAGLIHDLVAAQLRHDDGVDATPDRLVITAGCQEALVLCLQALCRSPGDTLLVCNPTYIGGTGAANTCGIPYAHLPSVGGSLSMRIELEATRLASLGMRARAVYLIPDFDNPTGQVITREERCAVLKVCERQRIVVLEDNPYGQFRYEGAQVPAMASLDGAGSVIYLSTYSKTLAPAFRVGSALLPRTLFGDAAPSTALFRDIVQRKSFLTVNTSQLNQGIVGGLLLANNASLRQWVEPVVAFYMANRAALLKALTRELGDVEGVAWNTPEGGFFLSLNLPFPMLADDVTLCAKEFGVVVMPMNFFASDASHDNVVRLAFSAATPSLLDEAVTRFAGYVRSRAYVHCA